MKPFGTWGVVACYQLGVIIGCLTGLAIIIFVLIPIGVTALVGLGFAMLVSALVGWGLSSYDAGAGIFDNAITGALIGVKKPTGIAITGASVAALAITAAVASVNPSQQVPPVSTQTDTPTALSSQVEPVSPSVNSQSQYACDDINLTPEEQVNCGTHSYQKTATKTSYCSIMELSNGNIDQTISFSGSTITVRDSQYTKISTNIYELVKGKINASDSVSKHVYTIVFNLNGYEERYAYGDSALLVDCWLKTYTLIK